MKVIAPGNVLYSEEDRETFEVCLGAKPVKQVPENDGLRVKLLEPARPSLRASLLGGIDEHGQKEQCG
jgi:hypothetical protein